MPRVPAPLNTPGLPWKRSSSGSAKVATVFARVTPKGRGEEGEVAMVDNPAASDGEMGPPSRAGVGGKSSSPFTHPLATEGAVPGPEQSAM